MLQKPGKTPISDKSADQRTTTFQTLMFLWAFAAFSARLEKS